MLTKSAKQSKGILVFRLWNTNTNVRYLVVTKIEKLPKCCWIDVVVVVVVDVVDMTRVTRGSRDLGTAGTRYS